MFLHTAAKRKKAPLRPTGPIKPGKPHKRLWLSLRVIVMVLAVILGVAVFFSKLLFNEVELLDSQLSEQSTSVLDTAAVDTAATLLQRARQVFCFGQGGSGILADEIWARFATISTKFRTAGDSHMELTTASLLGPEDVILFVSYSGATRDMMATLKTARANGVKIILITHFDDAPGTSLADVVLLCGARESPLDAGSIPVKASVLYVAEVLVLRFSLDNQELTSLSRERVSHALSAKLL